VSRTIELAGHHRGHFPPAENLDSVWQFEHCPQSDLPLRRRK
jgi:hypothetical protein